MKQIKKILRESIKKVLNERVALSSVDKETVKKYLLRLGFKIWMENDSIMRLYTVNMSEKEEDAVYRKAFDIIHKCGWTCSQCGGYYDGLRGPTQSIAEKEGTTAYAVTCFNIEADYGNEMNTDTVSLDDADEDAYLSGDEIDDRLGIGLEQYIFWHVTTKKFLRRIMKYGLIPKNGHEITNWRCTKDRVYLSLLPDFTDLYEEEEETPDFSNMDRESAIKTQRELGEEKVLLKINVEPIKDKIKFYPDKLYRNAVYTYNSIPPQCITVVNHKPMMWKYYVHKEIKDDIKYIVESNAKRTRIPEKHILTRFEEGVVDVFIKRIKWGRLSDMMDEGREDEIREMAYEVIEELLKEYN